MDPEQLTYALAAILITLGTLAALYGLHVLAHARDTLAGHEQATTDDPVMGHVTTPRPIRGRWH
jgi:hypothetical protein